MTGQARLLDLQSDLAALRVQASLVRLIAKHNFNPGEPRIQAGQPGGGRWTRVGNSFQSDRVTTHGLNAGVRANGFALRDKTAALPPQEREKARRVLVLAGGGGDFYVAPNLQANPHAPWYAAPSKSMVVIYDNAIIRVSGETGVDANLIRSIMYVETTQGSYAGLGEALDALGLSKTILPMNIYSSLWPTLGSRQKLEKPFYNILAAAKSSKALRLTCAYRRLLRSRRCTTHWMQHRFPTTVHALRRFTARGRG